MRKENKKMKKILNNIILIITFLLIFSINSRAATTGSFKVTAGATAIDIGKTTTITITTSNCEGYFSISSSDSNVASVSSSSEWVDGTTSIIITAKKQGVATITITASDVADTQTEPEVVTGSQTVKITVNAPVEEPDPDPEPEPEPEPEPDSDPQPQTPKEPTFKNVNETVYVQTESVNVRGTWSASGGQYGSLKKGDSVTRTGISSETINGYVWSRINYNGKTAYVISSALTTKKIEVEEEPEEKTEEEKSTNKLLKELKVEGYELSPKFDPQTTKYSLTLKEASETEEAEDSLEITAIPEDEKAKVDITGNEDFKVGNNIVKITVTAEDGTARIYSITVSKTNEESVVDSLKLSKLEIPNATLQPSFDPEVTNYVITIEDPSTITAEFIVAAAEDKNINITKSETTPDENGEKIITIMLEDKDSKKTGIYQITVKKPVINQSTPTITSSSDNTIYYILGGIIGVLLLLIIIVIIALRKTADKEENIKDANELDDDYDFNLKGAIDEVNKPYDDMVEESNFKSQILNTDTTNVENTKFSEETRVLDKFDKKYVEDEGFTPDVGPKKKGKHF